MVERSEPPFVHIPRGPSVAQEHPESLSVTGEDRDVHVFVVAVDTGERLDAPAPDDPPGPVEPGHEPGDGTWAESVPPAIPTLELLGRQVTRSWRLRQWDVRWR